MANSSHATISSVWWIGSHVLVALSFHVLGALLLPEWSDFAFYLSTWGTICVYSLTALDFGLAQALALKGSSFPIPRSRWSVASGLAAGLGEWLGIVAMVTTITLLHPLTRNDPTLQTVTGYVLWSVTVITRAGVLALAQGALLYRSVSRASVFIWSGSILVAWIAAQLAHSLPGWLFDFSRMRAPRSIEWMVGLIRHLTSTAIFAALMLPAVRRLLREPSSKVTGLMPKEAWPPAWRNAK